MKLSNYKKKLRSLSQVEPFSPAWLTSRQKLVDYLQANPQPTETIEVTGSFSRKFYFKPVYMAAMSLVLVLVGATGAFAQQALPGEPLYPLKKAMEKVEVALAVTKQTKAKTQMVFTERRLAEAEKLLDQNKTEAASEALQGYQEQLAELQPQLNFDNGSNPSKLKAEHEVLIKQQERLARMANRSAKLSLNKQSQLEDELIKVMGEAGSRELNLVDKISPDYFKADTIEHPEIKLEEETVKPTLEKVSGNKKSVASEFNWSVADIQKKIDDSNNLLQQLDAKLATVTNLERQEKLIKLYDGADQQLQLAQDSLTKISESLGDNNYKSTYRQVVKAYQSILELQVRLNSAASSSLLEIDDNGDNQTKFDKSKEDKSNNQSGRREDN
jgi:flagellin-specific chaperone FliS